MCKRHGNAIAMPGPAADWTMLPMAILAVLVSLGQWLVWIVDGALRPVAWALTALEARARRRRRLAHLAALQARTLHDIGLTRESVVLMAGLAGDVRAGHGRRERLDADDRACPSHSAA